MSSSKLQLHTAFIIYEPTITLDCVLSNSRVSFKLSKLPVNERTVMNEAIVKNTLSKIRKN